MPNIDFYPIDTSVIINDYNTFQMKVLVQKT